MLKKIKLPPLPQFNVDLELIAILNGKRVGFFSGPSHSFVRNWFNMQFLCAVCMLSAGSTYGAGYLPGKNPAGTVTGMGWAYGNDLKAGVGVDTWGILVGRGSAAESFEDYALTTKIAHGTSTNQLAHAAQSTTTAAYTSGTKTWAATLKRIFNNNSAAQIDVTETGLYGNGGYGVFMFSRDLLAASVPVPVGAQLTVTYLMSMTFPG